MLFSELKLIEPLLRALEEEGYKEPTPIQERSIPHVLVGRDLLGCAQTGTGKTAAFALPILQRLTESKPATRVVRVLVLAPTRELASQIGESFSSYGRHLPFHNNVIFGGVNQSGQVRLLRQSPDILVATPGRLLDLMSQRLVSLANVEVFVLDEADRMLDMGFIHDVRKVIAVLPQKRQTLLFSATMPPDIQRLADAILKSPARAEAAPVATTAEKIAQSIYFVRKSDKRMLLDHLLKDAAIERVLVFTRTKHGADRVVEQLGKSRVVAAAIHGNKSQNARERALSGFKRGDTRVLVATDIAARGIDIDGISHVINYDLPNIPESYVHRIGRTARAGASGIAFSFCDREERAYLADIEKVIRMRVPVVAEHPFHAAALTEPAPEPDAKKAVAEQKRRFHAQNARRGPPRNGGRPSRHR